jgi:beta-glucuronidase
MRAVRAVLGALLAALALGAVALPATAGAAATPPTSRALYADGPTGRYLLDGTWLFRLDPGNQGLRGGWARRASTSGWSPVTVPNAWNAADDSDASMRGGIGWYRRDFTLPSSSSAYAWIARFESVNYRATVWLNGRRIGAHAGVAMPFELDLSGVKAKGTNRLVVRVDSVREPFDFPPSGENLLGIPTGGWWNDSGLLREVYVRRVRAVTWDQGNVLVRPTLACPTCDARITMSASLRNVTGDDVAATVTGDYGGRTVHLGTRRVPARGVATFSRVFTLRSPHLWSIEDPYLYPASLAVRVGKRTVAGYALRSGVRSITVSGGRLLLNGRALDVRGVGYHEDTKELGFAVDDATRDRLVNETLALGGRMMRTHYPPHPYLEELADRAGILLWSEIPVYSLAAGELAKGSVRRAALDELRTNIGANQNHASIVLWSVANELSSKVGASQARYLQAAATLARQLDPTRPVGYALAGYATAGCQAGYGPIDVLGINDYFGWYPGPGGQLMDRTGLSAYLDQMRACYPGKALMITEFGAEANRLGPPEEKGTYAFQQEFADYHLGVFATKPWLSGALYWALNEFRARPAWEGGNPRPSGVLHTKGLLQWGSWARKPAWDDVHRWYTQTQQLAPAAPPAAPAAKR